MENGSTGSICGTCKHATDCLYTESKIVRLFCEEFEVDVTLNPNIASGQKNHNEYKTAYGNLAGLCMNCDNNPVCVYSQPDYEKAYCLEHA